MKDEGHHGGPSFRRVWRYALLPSAFCLLPFLTGCNVVGAIAAKAGPEPTIKAQFAPAKEQTAVLVENFHNPASLRLESDAIARHLAEELKMHEAAPIVEPETVEALRQTKGGAYRKMPLDAVAKALGAKQVIYVDLERFDLVQAIASELPSGEAQARVRVVDDTGALLWPIDSAGGFPVTVKVDPQHDAITGGEQAVSQRLHAALADKLAKLFYDWKGDSADGEQEHFTP